MPFLYSSTVYGNTTPVVVDIDSDGKPDIILADNELLMALSNKGNALEGFPIYLNEQNERITKSPAVGDVNGDGYLDIALVTENLAPPGGKLHVYNRVGGELPGWPKTFSCTPSSPPAIGDVDADGDLEIVMTVQSDDTSVMHVLKKDGNSENGWPKTFNGVVLPPPVLADVDTPDDVEIVVAGTEPGYPPKGHLYVFKSDGTQHRHFEKIGAEFPIRPIVGDFLQIWGNQAVVPERIDGELKWFLIYQIGYGQVYDNIHTSHSISCTPTAADADGDGKYELVVGMIDRIMAYNFDDFTQVDGWTGGLAGYVKAPVVSDVNGDGLTDVVVGDGKAVYVMTTNTAYGGFPNDLDWIGPRHDNLNTGLFDIAAPTGVHAYDRPSDQGGVIVVQWAPSIDDGLRSSRLQKYMLFRGQMGGDSDDLGGNWFLKPVAYRKKLREGGIGNRPGKIYEKRKFTGEDEWSAARGGEMDIIYEKIAVLPAGTTLYEDHDVVNGEGYDYYLVATSTSGEGSVGNDYRYSQPSVSKSAAAHDNIPPAPPTNFDGDVIDDGAGNVYIYLSWDLSFDDPYYSGGQPGDGSPAAANVYAPAPEATASDIRRPGAVASVYAGNDSPTVESFRASAGPGFASFPLSEKEGEALKVKAAERRVQPRIPRTTGPRPASDVEPADGGLDAGANDVQYYDIWREVDGQAPCLPHAVLEAGTSEFDDLDVEYGHFYKYTIYAKDSENSSEGCGPVYLDTNSHPGFYDDGGPLAFAPGGPSALEPYYDPSGGGSLAAPFAVTGWGASRTRAASVITCKPNPVTGTATFTITLPTACPVKLDVYDLAGRRVDTVLDKTVREGGETVLWQPRVPTGVYIYRLETPGRQYSGKVVVAR